MKYARHAPAADEIYCVMMAERTGEDPDNYRGRPFDMELLFFEPSKPWPTGPLNSYLWPPEPARAPQQRP